MMKMLKKVLGAKADSVYVLGGCAIITLYLVNRTSAATCGRMKRKIVEGERVENPKPKKLNKYEERREEEKRQKEEEKNRKLLEEEKRWRGI